jgi:hypothetical protein
MGIQGFMQPFPELQNNLGFFIGHNPHGYSMKQTIIELYISARCGPV